MSYGSGEAAILELLRDMTAFDAANTSRADWKPLNSGASDHYAVLRPGEWYNSIEAIGHGAAVTTWRTVVEVWQRWLDDSPTALALQDLTTAVIEHIEAYPSLDGAVALAWVAGGGDMQERWLRSGGPAWAVWEVYIDWQEERFITVTE